MTPAARISLNGKDVTTAWHSVLVSITVTDEAGGKSDSCEVVLDNREAFAAPPQDAELQVWLGYEPTPVYMGRYKITSWRKRGMPKLLTVTARAVDLTAEMKARKTRSWHDTTVQGVVEQIASDHGLSATVDEGLGANAIPHLDQQTESDMAFLTRLAKRQGATFKLADGKILFAAKGSDKSPSGTAKSAITIAPNDLSEWDVGVEERATYKSVITHYVDPHTNKTVQVATGSGKPAHRDSRQYGSKAEAQAAGKAAMGDLARGKMTGDIEGPGTPEWFAEALVTLKGFDPDVDGDFLGKTVTHTYTKRGYTTSMHVETKSADTETVSDDADE